ncbi:hypothetical protein J7X41_000678 [Vibrio parahaemolyticus]|nr:hypothetical protein [Vibrio parahaemolyticus]
MKFSRVSTFLFGLIACITGVGTLYISLLQPSPSLAGYVHEGIFYVPEQYMRQEKEIEQLTNSYHIRSSLNEYEEDLSYSQKKNIADMLSDSIEKAKKPFFSEGLHKYRSLVYFHVYNNGDAVAKDVYIELPEKALLMIEDQGGQYSHPEELIHQYKIKQLRQKGKYRFWAWFPMENKEINIYDIKIGSDTQVADIEYAEEYTGYSALLARYSEFVYAVLAMFMFMFIYTLYEAFFCNDTSQEET